MFGSPVVSPVVQCRCRVIRCGRRDVANAVECHWEFVDPFLQCYSVGWCIVGAGGDGDGRRDSGGGS